jgi:hypothetical protein
VIARASSLAAKCGVVLLIVGAAASAGAEPIPGPATDVYPGTREYEWTFYVPVMTIERRPIVLPGPKLKVRSRRYDYEVPGLKTERRKIGQVAELYCKYPDWQLPNECGFAWHDVYGDFPQLTMRREHIDVDVPEWTDGEHRIFVDVPHWTWEPRTLTLILPVLATEPPPPRRWGAADAPALADASLERARDTLDAGQTTASKAIDEAIDALSKSIAATEAEGGDASTLAGSDGAKLDLYAVRQSLLEQKALQDARYARIRTELDDAARAQSQAF